MDRAHRPFATLVIPYLVTALLAIFITVLCFRLWRADLRVPFGYAPGGGDAFINMMQVKSTLQTGWYFHNPCLGAPGTLDQLDFPVPDSLHFALMRIIGWFTGDFGSALNIYFLLTFPFTALAALHAGRAAGLKCPAAMAVAQLFAFLPFHLLRGETHLTLNSYYLVPLTLPATLRIARGESLGRGGWLAGIAFALIAASNVYHAAFAVFFLIVAAIIGIVRRGPLARSAVAQAAGVALLCGVVFGLQLVPNIVHRHAAGLNPLAVNRSPADADTYGLKISQMLLPVPGHRIANLARLRAIFAGEFPNINENESSALGIIGAAGFLMLLLRIGLGLTRARSIGANESIQPSDGDVLLDTLAMLTLAGLLLATVGGFGAIFDFLIVPFIRAYNRISLFLGLFALIAFAAALEPLVRRPRAQWALWLVIACIGLFDQIPANAAPDYSRIAADFHSDERFVAAIESRTSPRAMIFQLPFVEYPESPPIHDLSDYELFRGYLHSKQLHWSYGAMKGREASRWQRRVAREPVGPMIDDLRQRGFAGIYLDRNAYGDDAQQSQLAAILGPPLVSDNHRLIFFALRARQPATGTSRLKEPRTKHTVY